MQMYHFEKAKEFIKTLHMTQTIWFLVWKNTNKKRINMKSSYSADWFQDIYGTKFMSIKFSEG